MRLEGTLYRYAAGAPGVVVGKNKGIAMRITIRSCIYAVMALSLITLASSADDLQLQNDLIATRELTNVIYNGLRAGSVDELWSVYSAKRIDGLISEYGNESNAKEHLKKQCSRLIIDHWTIIREKYDKSNDSLMITLNVYETAESQPVQAKELFFIRESGVWKLFN